MTKHRYFSHARRLVGRAALLTVIALGAGLPHVAQAVPSRSRQQIAGTWATLVPIALTEYQPAPGHPLEGTFQGVGSSEWQGTWRGVTKYTMGGYANLTTGAGSGWLYERFVGRSSDGGVGSITFWETYTLTENGHFHVEVTILGGTRDFETSSGYATFDGTTYSAAFGSGTYRGSWSRSG